MAKIFDIDYSTKDEIIVEKMLWNGRFTAVAKVIAENRRESDVLSDGGLKEVLKLLNWKRTDTQREVIPNGVYSGLYGFRRDGFAVVLMVEIEGCGINVFFRRHDNLEYGLFYDTKIGMWRNGSREQAVKTIKENMLIYEE